jgi:uncharacterized protein YkwD
MIAAGGLVLTAVVALSAPGGQVELARPPQTVGASSMSAGAAADTPRDRQSQESASAEDLEGLAREAFGLLNQSRIEAGLEPLELDPSLSLLASHHSREIAYRGRVSHHSTEYGLSTERRVRIAFPDVPRLAENVARNRTVTRLHAALLSSPGHRRNRMDPEFTHVGIGLARGGEVALYLTEVFVTSTSGPLGDPVAFYFDAAPGTYEARDNPRVEQGPRTITVGPPGPDDPEYWTDRGIGAYGEGRLDDAEEAFRKALELKPDYDYAKYNLARVLISNEAVEEAATLLDELIETDPDDIDAIATRGTAAIFLNDFSAAAEYFRRVLRERPRDANNWYNFGLALEYQDRPRDAAVAYREALDINPNLTAAAVGLARVTRQ